MKYYDTDKVEFVNTVIHRHPQIIKPSYHELQLLDELYCDKPIQDNFKTFLLNKFSKDEVHKAMQDYFLTGTNLKWNNATIFWQIDNREYIHAGKIMLYNASNGKRVKTPYNHISWMHKALKLRDFNLCQCIFGLHLINEDYQKTIAIVEAEKTAIMMSIIIPDFIWLATGSRQNLKHELLKPIKNRNIVLFPDNNEYEDWNNKAKRLNEDGYKIAVSEFLEQTNIEAGLDLADVYLDEVKPY